MKNFSILGGDHRSIVIAKELSLHGFSVTLFGCNGEAKNEPAATCKTLASAISDADYVILPMPCSSGDSCLNAPMHKEAVKLTDVVSSLSKNQTVLGGKIDSDFADMLLQRGICFYDYANREELTVLNAVATAEGALAIALDTLPVTVNGLHVLITGFGRIAKLLANILQAMGAHVTVTARKQSDLAWMQAYGYSFFPICRIAENIQHFDLIYNTVPATIFSREVLHNMKQDALLIDLASRPGGVDFSSAENMGKHVIHALSLPGKTAPLTAGKIICETVLNIIQESEVKI
ncbi:MAG: dipicolinate synthase subunit DpsA [Ruminococcaceae bacterium]|nr:dipicolinate synthase subunit DpsA [Oscillospiraceae bacterium]